MASLEHLAILKKGVRHWNDWRWHGDHEFVIPAGVSSPLFPDLSNADLSGMNLAGAMLFETDLFGTNLSSTDLRRADLRGFVRAPKYFAPL